MTHLPPNPNVPRGPKLETILVCADGTCGRCSRCLFQKGAAILQEEQGRVIQRLRELTALTTIQREALRSVALRLEDDEAASAGLLQVVSMTPEEALALLEGMASHPTEEANPAPVEIAAEVHAPDGAPAPSFDLTSTAEDAAHD